MILVADCSALMALSICNRLEILEQIFGQVLVPYDIVVGDKPCPTHLP